MIQFEPGKTYATRSICDHECIFKVTIASRTPKTVKTIDGKTFRVAAWHSGECEYIKPLGSYSMAPMIRADKAI
jgi:hypothetical protein